MLNTLNIKDIQTFMLTNMVVEANMIVYMEITHLNIAASFSCCLYLDGTGKIHSCNCMWSLSTHLNSSF